MTEATENKAILDLATKRYHYAKSAWANIYALAESDLKFVSGAPNAQWPEEDAIRRTNKKRPVLEVDQLTQFIHQVSNDIRMNTPTIKVIPDGMEANPKTAEALQGRIKAIEYKSNADSAYDMASDFAIKSSIGFIRVDHDYVGDGFEQELRIKRVTNPLGILLDPDSVQSDGSDAKYAFVFDEITVADFTKQYPEANPIAFGDEKAPRHQSDDDKIMIVEYFTIGMEEAEYGLDEDGKPVPVEEGKEYKKTRKIEKPKVKRYWLAGQDVLTKGTFPGKYVPVVPVYGEEAWEKGERKLLSLIRKAKSSQYMYNLWKSLETEMLLKQPQSPFMAAAGTISGFEEQYKNPEEAMVLLYNQKDVNGEPAPKPDRAQPPTIPTGFTQASLGAENNIRQTLGMYNASAGRREGNASGVALKQLEQSSDVGNYHFGDNLVRSITQVGKILVCAIPEIEDTKRYVQIITNEDEFKRIGINGVTAEDQEDEYDFTKAAQYDVRVITGASFTTQRQEAAATYNQIIQAMPDLMPVIGDLVFKYQDSPGSMAISNRLKKLVDPKLLDEKDREGMEDAQQAQIQAVITELQGQIQMLQSELQSKQTDAQVKMAEVQIKAKEVEIKEGELQLKLMQAQKPEAMLPDDSFDKALKAKEVEIKAFDAETKRIAALQKAPEAQMGIKLDTNGFQIMKTPEQLELEEQEMLFKAEIEAQQATMKQQELLEKQAQAQALLDGLSGIQQAIGALVQSVNQPIEVLRDEQGNLIGAK